MSAINDEEEPELDDLPMEGDYNQVSMKKLKKRKKKKKKPINQDQDDASPSPNIVSKNSMVTDVESKNLSHIASTSSAYHRMEELTKLQRIVDHKEPLSEWSSYFVNEVVGKGQPNPFSENPPTEDKMIELLGGYVRYLAQFARNSILGNGSDEPMSQDLQSAYEQIKKLNADLVKSIGIVGGFRGELHDVSKKFCRKFVALQKHIYCLIDAEMDPTCGIPSCQFDKITKYVVLDGYSHGALLDADDDEKETEKPKVFGFCCRHLHLYDLYFTILHMDWNVVRNCKKFFRDILKERTSGSNNTDNSSDSDIELPKEAVSSIIVYYMARYQLFWFFGDHKDWKERGCEMWRMGFDSEIQQEDDLEQEVKPCRKRKAV